jgi:hypothetical protein
MRNGGRRINNELCHRGSDLGGKTISAKTISALTLSGTGLIWPAMKRVFASILVAKRRRRRGTARARVHA